MRKIVHVISIYASEDGYLWNSLDQYLSLWERNGIISNWHNGKMIPGQEIQAETEKHWQKAQLILLLVSANMFAPATYQLVERAMQWHRAGKVWVVPIMLLPVAWQGSPFDGFSVLPTNQKPVTQWDNRDQAFAEIARSLYSIIDEISSGSNNLSQSLPSQKLPEEAAFSAFNRQIAKDSSQLPQRTSFNNYGVNMDQRGQRVNTQNIASRDLHIHNKRSTSISLVLALIAIIIVFVLLGPALKLIPPFAHGAQSVTQLPTQPDQDLHSRATPKEQTSLPTSAVGSNSNGSSNVNGSMNATFSGYISGPLVVNNFESCINSNKIYMISVSGSVNSVAYHFHIGLSSYDGPGTYIVERNKTTGVSPQFSISDSNFKNDWWNYGQPLNITVNNDEKSGTFSATMVRTSTSDSDKVSVVGNWTCAHF